MDGDIVNGIVQLQGAGKQPLKVYTPQISQKIVRVKLFSLELATDWAQPPRKKGASPGEVVAPGASKVRRGGAIGVPSGTGNEQQRMYGLGKQQREECTRESQAQPKHGQGRVLPTVMRGGAIGVPASTGIRSSKEPQEHEDQEREEWTVESQDSAKKG